MHRTLTIFRKELKDTLRDRRTLFMMVVMPLLLIPLLVTVVAKIQSSQYEKAEAQSIITPLNIAVILPAVVGVLPGIELDAKMALVPILNVSLATKDLLAGSINPFYLAEVYLSLFLLAGLSLWGCAKWFNREATLFRS